MFNIIKRNVTVCILYLWEKFFESVSAKLPSGLMISLTKHWTKNRPPFNTHSETTRNKSGVLHNAKHINYPSQEHQQRKGFNKLTVNKRTVNRGTDHCRYSLITVYQQRMRYLMWHFILKVVFIVSFIRLIFTRFLCTF